MGEAKKLIVKPIPAQDGNRIIRELHYSGKVATTSRVHLGVFMGDRCGGAMQFGGSICKRNLIGLVKGTLWNEFLELNRLAFADWLPRNSESRCIGFAMRWLRKTYPWLKWVVSFADGTQCGDGTIYRASGFVLTGIKKSSSLWKLKTGEVVCDIVSRMKGSGEVRRRIGFAIGETWSSYALRTGAQRLPGFQLRYIYFLDPTARERLTVPILPFSEIDRRGAGMYKGIKRGRSDTVDTPANPAGEGGSTPTLPLQNLEPIDK